MNRLLLFMGLTLLVSTSHGDPLRISGSTSVLPLLQQIVTVYRESHPGVRIDIRGGGSGAGVAELLAGRVDIAMSSRFISRAEFQRAAANGVYPVPLHLANDAIVPVIHPGNPLRDLSLSQLQGIYSGALTSWSQLGGPDWPIQAICRDRNSGTRATWNHLVMQDHPLQHCDYAATSSHEVIARVREEPAAIGYVSLASISVHAGGRPWRVDKQAGTPACVRAGCYPLTRPLFLFTNGWPDARLMHFIDFALHSEPARALIRRSGLTPAG